MEVAEILLERLSCRDGDGSGRSTLANLLETGQRLEEADDRSDVLRLRRPPARAVKSLETMKCFSFPFQSVLSRDL